MNCFEIQIENTELANAVFDMLQKIEGLQIKAKKGKNSINELSKEQHIWLEILGILAEIPCEYLPLILKVMEGVYLPILEKYRAEYQEFEKEERAMAEEGMWEYNKLLKKEDNL
jgi:hypothetical protein